MDELQTVDGVKCKYVSSQDQSPKHGQWYWVKSKDKSDWLACVEKIGTNYVKLRSIENSYGGHSTIRVHFDDFNDKCRLESNPKKHIDSQVENYQNKVNSALAEIKSITKRLGLSKQHALEMKQNNQGSNQLAVISSTSDIKQHENQLVKAKEELLPELFKKVEKSTKQVAIWMKAESLPLEIMAMRMKDDIGDIDSRIFNVKLYGGIDEHIHVIREGEHAPIDEKIHIFQNKKYMDEECLVNYKSGGMDFKDLDQFCNWLLLDDNLERIFPYPKSVVPFQIRRHKKLRKAVSLGQAFDNLIKEQIDKTTYFLIRNGDAVYFVDSLMEFPDKVFPDKNEFDPSQPIYFTIGSFNKIEWVYKNEFEDRKNEELNNRAKAEKWRKENPDKSWVHNPYEGLSHNFDFEKWELLNDDSVYFDDFNDHMSSIIKSYNRITLVLQGLLDRSPVFHPHPNIQAWKTDSFNNCIRLVYDHDRTLPEGPKPDIKAYIKKCNALIKKGSIVFGQYDYWKKHEIKKENDRRDRRINYTEHINYFCAPYGNPGPGHVSEIASMMKKSNKATFVWYRERVNWVPGKDDIIRTSISVPIDQLFNIDAYKPGDFKVFFKDPRTRADYMDWAPMLLSAEDYHAGIIKAKKAYCEDTMKE